MCIAACVADGNAAWIILATLPPKPEYVSDKL